MFLCHLSSFCLLRLKVAAAGDEKANDVVEYIRQHFFQHDQYLRFVALLEHEALHLIIHMFPSFSCFYYRSSEIDFMPSLSYLSLLASVLIICLYSEISVALIFIPQSEICSLSSYLSQPFSTLILKLFFFNMQLPSISVDGM